jgi:CRISPR-associated endoribonuclease cas2
MILFFDLPTETSQERREYTRFRKYLLKSGFMMMQESVYCKIALNQTVVNSLYDSLQKNKPGKGLIQVLTVTEKQFSKMEFILGEYHGDIINTDERFVEL